MDKLPKPLLPKLLLFMLSLIGALALGSGLGEGWRGVSPRAAGAMEVPRRELAWLAQAPTADPATAEPGVPEPEVPEPLAAEPVASLAVLTLSPDGQYMVRGTGAGALEWLDDQGQTTGQVQAQAHRGAVVAVVISRDGQTVISTGADGVLRRWDRQGNALGEATLRRGPTLVALALSPDGQRLLAGRVDGLLEQWAVGAGTAQGDPITAHAAAIQALDFLVGGQNWVTGSQDGSLALWNVDGRLARQIPAAHGGGVTVVVGSPDGQTLASTGGDGTLRFWDRVTFQPQGETLAAHTAPIRAAAYSPDGQTLATAAADGSLRLWNVDGTSRWPNPVMLDSEPSFLAFTPAGDLVVGSIDGQVERLGPQGDQGASPPPLDPPPEAQPSPSDSLDFLQNLPQNTWWIVAAIPALLIVIGSLSAWLGGSQRPAAEDDQDTEGQDVDRQGVVPSDSDIPSVGAVASVSPPKSARVPAPSPGLGADATAEASPLPPEAELRWDWAEATASEVAPSPANPPMPGGQDIAAQLPPEANLVATGETVPRPPTHKLEQARADLAAGRQQLRATQYEAALLCFNSAIEATEVERLKAEALGTPMGGINALATLAQTQRGHALGLLEQSGEAMASYHTALGLDSAAVEAWIGKGRLLIALGRYEEALFCFDSALELDSSLGPAWAGKGQALLRLGRHAEGQTCHHRALALGLEGLGPLPPYPTLDPSTLLAAGDASTPAWPSDAAVPLDQPAPSFPDNGDPDVPLDLQQLVMGLPSADTDLAYAFPSDYGVPPELVADVADLPGQAETSVEAPTWPGMAADPSPLARDLGTAPWVGPIPESSEAEDSPLDDTDPSSNPDRLVEAHWNPDQGWPTPKATALDPSALEAPIPTVAGGSEASNAVLPGRPVSTAAFPSAMEFIPPAEFDEDWPQDLPPEVLAAMASIPAGSPDAFADLPRQDGPTSNSPAARIQSGIKITLDRSQGPRFYALWHIEEEDRVQAKRSGGEVLAVRLYDVTGHPTQTPLPPPVEEQRCHDDFAQDWYLAIPHWDRIYLAEIGYLSNAGQWQVIARSSEVPAIANG